MNLSIFFNTIFGSLNNLELIVIVLITALFTYVFVKIRIIKNLKSLSGIGIILVIACFVSLGVKAVYMIYKPQIDKTMSGKNHFIADLFDEYTNGTPDNSTESTEPDPAITPDPLPNIFSPDDSPVAENNKQDDGVSVDSRNNKKDDGVLVGNLPPNREASRMQYSEVEIKNSLDKIVDDFGFEAIFYLQRVVLNARELAGSPNVVYMKLEDYAFICSMNICNKYLYDFSSMKDSNQREGYFLVLVIPEFVVALNNYTNLKEIP
ncbi:MAG: hypothetical protein FWE18_06090 [Alphaproteobacteria bacterium]|nr:hypothetical protein [Alphaproteobacteria bacterium]